MVFIQYVCRVPLRMSDEDLAIGDYAIHGEEPYTFEYYNRNYRRVAGYGHEGPTDMEKASQRASGSHARSDPSDGILMGQDPELAAGGPFGNGSKELPVKRD